MKRRTKNGKKYNIGFIAGQFDLIHSNYIDLFKFCKEYCNLLYVGLNKDASVYNKNKIPPVCSLEERWKVLTSIVYIDKIFVYKDEIQLYCLLEKIKPDVRFLGDDYKINKITGSDLDIDIIFHKRSTGDSTTVLKKKIYHQMKNRMYEYRLF